MTTFLEDWHHQGSAPVSRDFASVQGSLINDLEDENSDIGM